MCPALYILRIMNIAPTKLTSVKKYKIDDKMLQKMIAELRSLRSTMESQMFQIEDRITKGLQKEDLSYSLMALKVFKKDIDAWNQIYTQKIQYIANKYEGLVKKATAFERAIRMTGNGFRKAILKHAKKNTNLRFNSIHDMNVTFH